MTQNNQDPLTLEIIVNRNLPGISAVHSKDLDRYIEVDEIVANIERQLIALIKSARPEDRDERPTEDGVPVETYGYEETYNQGIADTMQAILALLGDK